LVLGQPLKPYLYPKGDIKMKTEDFKILFHWSEARKLVNIPNETEFTGDKAFKFLEIVKNIDKSKKKLGLGYYKTKLTFNFGKDIQHELRIDLGDGDLLLKPNAW
jgi:hypothetical protein